MLQWSLCSDNIPNMFSLLGHFALQYRSPKPYSESQHIVTIEIDTTPVVDAKWKRRYCRFGCCCFFYFAHGTTVGDAAVCSSPFCCNYWSLDTLGILLGCSCFRLFMGRALCLCVAQKPGSIGGGTTYT